MTDHLCLRWGYECNCAQCLPWKNRWDKELEAFSIIDNFIQDGKCLFHICKWLSAEHPDILQGHYKFIEETYIESKMETHPPPPTKPRKKQRQSLPAPPSKRSPPTPHTPSPISLFSLPPTPP